LVKLSFLKEGFAIAISLAMLVIAIGSASAGCVGDETSTDFGWGDTVTESCTFNGDLVCSVGHGLIVGADNITIDGNGYTLDGLNSACTWEDIRCGILNEGYDGVVIKKLEIKNFCFGIRLRGNSSNHIENDTIENCNLHHNGNATSELATHGIKMEYVFNSTIRNNSIHHQISHVNPNPGCEDGGNGLFLYSGDYNLITQNKFYNNTKGGFFMKAMPAYNNISYNNLWRNGQGGIILRCKLCDFNLIEYNNASDNYGSGIFIGGNNNTVRSNTICNNKDGGPYYEDIGVGGRGYGINIGRSDGSSFNTLISNKICGNDYQDIYVVLEVTGNTGDGNTCDTTHNYNDEGSSGCTYSCESNLGCVAADGTVYGCGDTVMRNCTFNGNLNCPLGHGLIVGTNDITINGASFCINGSSIGGAGMLAGIYSKTTDNTKGNKVSIKNLEIKNFCNGIYIAGTLEEGACRYKAEKGLIENCKIHDNNGTSNVMGIKVTCMNNLTIRDCEIYNNSGGEMEMTCEWGGNGIFIKCGNHNKVLNNLIYNNKKAGFFTKGGPSDTIVANNTVSGNYNQGGIILMCKKSNTHIIENNTVTDNHGCGIYIGGPENTIRNNIVKFTKGNGIYFGRCTEWGGRSGNNTIYGNIVCKNEDRDIAAISACIGRVNGDDNTCDTTYNYDDEGTTDCTNPCFTAPIFDTSKGTYPSISGTHKGKIILDEDITVNKMYTYPCEGTGGHTEYVKIWNESEAIEGEGNGSGYHGDYHNITILPPITLRKDHEYNYIIRTGSYPQIVHASEYKAEDGGNITCTEFIDANNKRYDDWIPAIRLYLG
jgi:parallel beta-helix repeat protein